MFRINRRSRSHPFDAAWSADRDRPTRERSSDSRRSLAPSSSSSFLSAGSRSTASMAEKSTNDGRTRSRNAASIS